MAVVTTYTYSRGGDVVSIIRDGKVTILPSEKIRRRSRAKPVSRPASEPVPTWEELMELWRAHVEERKKPPAEEQ